MGTFAALQEEYDLTYRPEVEDVSCYRLRIEYQTLDELGMVSGREEYQGDFRRVVDSVEPTGAVIETITWRNSKKRTGSPDSFDDWEDLPFLQDFSYPFSAEQDYDEFHWKYDGFPQDLIGWFSVLLTVDAHFEFDYLRSTRHGSIEQLRRLGDSVLTPDSNHPFWLGLPPIVDVPAFNKQNLRTSFAALTQRNGEPCVLLKFDMNRSPFEMDIMGMKIEASTSFDGSMAVRLSDGSLEHGEFLEYVMQSTVNIRAVYEITRLDVSEF